MKVVIAGSRHIYSNEMVERAIDESGFEITELLSGMADGIDRIAASWARFYGIPVREYLPDWAQHGRAAGMIRNGAMARDGEALIAIWDGASHGTRDMISKARRAGLRAFVLEVRKNPAGRWEKVRSYEHAA